MVARPGDLPRENIHRSGDAATAALRQVAVGPVTRVAPSTG